MITDQPMRNNQSKNRLSNDMQPVMSTYPENENKLIALHRCTTLSMFILSREDKYVDCPNITIPTPWL